MSTSSDCENRGRKASRWVKNGYDEKNFDRNSSKRPIEIRGNDNKKAKRGRGYNTDQTARGYRSESHQRRDFEAYDGNLGRFDHDGSPTGPPTDRKWACLEGRCENDAERSRFDDRGSTQPRHPRGRSEPNGGDDVDEFGRKKSKHVSKPSGTRWPPAFDKRSATYAFDARSGMFYHSSTEFFYDPKTKLYYGNKQKAYFRHSPGKSPPFVEIVYDTKSAGDSGDQKEEEEDGNAKAKDQKKIAISLKTKLLPGSDQDGEKKKEEDVCKAVKDTALGSAQLSRAQRQRAENINRWSERVKEDEADSSLFVVSTKKGLPVCLLCKRKFPNIAKLRLHEKRSELHRENAIRRKAIEEKLAAQYRDRAKERRILHGIDGTPSSAIRRTEEVPEMKPVRQHGDLDSSNIGNKMLQKLGWKSGSSVGRGSGEDGLGKAIEKDWERIEALAMSNQPEQLARK